MEIFFEFDGIFFRTLYRGMLRPALQRVVYGNLWFGEMGAELGWGLTQVRWRAGIWEQRNASEGSTDLKAK